MRFDIHSSLYAKNYHLLTRMNDIGFLMLSALIKHNY